MYFTKNDIELKIFENIPFLFVICKQDDRSLFNVQKPLGFSFEPAQH